MDAGTLPERGWCVVCNKDAASVVEQPMAPAAAPAQNGVQSQTKDRDINVYYVEQLMQGYEEAAGAYDDVLRASGALPIPPSSSAIEGEQQAPRPPRSTDYTKEELRVMTKQEWLPLFRHKPCPKKAWRHACMPTSSDDEEVD